MTRTNRQALQPAKNELARRHYEQRHILH